MAFLKYNNVLYIQEFWEWAENQMDNLSFLTPEWNHLGFEPWREDGGQGNQKQLWG